MVSGTTKAAVATLAPGLRSASDAELAERIGSGSLDADAEAELCRRFAPRIRLYAIKHLRSEERARDLVQSVLLAVLEAIRGARLKDPERLDRFVLGTCRNLAYQAQRADTRAEPTEAARLELAAVLPEHDPPDMEALWRCMSGLDQRARSVVYLSFQRDKRAEDIARVLETTAGNVRVVRHRALAQLRHCLEQGVA
jgi:RNA polymerase sigma-70 factor (ECF subfamily)